MKEIIATPNAPAAIGPYAAADVAGQTEQSLKNIGAILAQAGMGYENVVKTTVLLADIADFGTMNEVYAKCFTADCPARAAFAVKDLPKGALVEIEAVAWKD